MNGKSDIYFEHGGCALAALPENVRSAAYELGTELTGIRIRPGKAAQLTYAGGDRLVGHIDRQAFDKLVSTLMGHSLYARENELARGYFTLPDGSRVGVSGNYTASGPRSISDIGAVNIRIAREIKGCADSVIEYVMKSYATLIIAPPGAGKTTILRDIARQLSEHEKNVCIIDERDELAACINGMPALDVGPRTDVISGMTKHRAMIMAVRSLSPDVIIADEIGDAKDAEAVNDALRCGVRVIVSAHGKSLDKRRMRPVVGRLAAEGAFDLGILLGTEKGRIAEIAAYGERGVLDE